MSVYMQAYVYVDLINCTQGEGGMAVLLNEMQYIVVLLYNIMLMYIIPARSTTTVKTYII